MGDKFYSSPLADGHLRDYDVGIEVWPSSTFSIVGFEFVDLGPPFEPVDYVDRAYFSFDTHGYSITEATLYFRVITLVYDDAPPDGGWIMNVMVGANVIGNALSVAAWGNAGFSLVGTVEATGIGWLSKGIDPGLINGSGDTDFEIKANWSQLFGKNQFVMIRQTEYTGQAQDPYLDLVATLLSSGKRKRIRLFTRARLLHRR